MYFLNSHGILRYDQSSHVTTPLGGPTGDLAASASDPRRLYVSSSYSLQFWRSSDGGKTWTDLTGHLLGFPNPLLIASLAVDPNDPDIVFMTAQTSDALPHPPFAFRGLLRSADGGNSWNFLKPALGVAPLGLLTFAPGSPSTLYLVACRVVSWSTDSGATWSASSLPSPDECPASSPVVVDPQIPSTIYEAASDLFRSRDAGATWSRIGILDDSGGRTAFSVAVDPNASSTLIVQTWQSGLLRTTDGGSSWEDFNSGLPCVPLLHGPCGGVTPSPLAFSQGKASVAYFGRDAVFRTGLPTNGDCVLSQTVACAGQRFSVSVTWSSGAGVVEQAYPVVVTANSAGFWFFSPDNVELVIKVLDGTQVNGKWWVFYGALSNVEYTITVTDTQTGAVKTYFNPQGNLASIADTEAF
jgi:photosystem II stability/assembly factor-like uncharacterized protein